MAVILIWSSDIRYCTTHKVVMWKSINSQLLVIKQNMKNELLDFTSHTTQYSQQNITKEEKKITYKVREHI